MLAAYFRDLSIFSFTVLSIFAVFLNHSELHCLSGGAFGALILVLNIALFVVLLSAIDSLSNVPHKTLIHRLSLLLVIFIKGFNLLFLSYVGIHILHLGAFAVVIGAMLGLAGHIAYYGVITKYRFSQDRVLEEPFNV